MPLVLIYFAKLTLHDYLNTFPRNKSGSIQKKVITFKKDNLDESLIDNIEYSNVSFTGGGSSGGPSNLPRNRNGVKSFNQGKLATNPLCPKNIFFKETPEPQPESKDKK